jgi:hypothetical protein
MPPGAKGMGPTTSAGPAGEYGRAIGHALPSGIETAATTDCVRDAKDHSTVSPDRMLRVEGENDPSAATLTRCVAGL